MSDDPKLTKLLADLRNKGHLPALDSNVGTICSLAEDPHTSTSELTAVILRDCALTSSIISTSNSALYRPSEPVKTVSGAIIIMGFETVKSLALGMSIIKQINQCAQGRNLYRLFACSYFAGMFAMALGQKTQCDNPEELRVAGILSAFPRLLLANAFPDQYSAMESRIMNGSQSLQTACLEVFGVRYDDFTMEIAHQWNMPASVEKCLRGTSKQDPAVGLVYEAGRISDMMFGNVTGGAEALKNVESALKTRLQIQDFQLSEFIDHTCTADPNVLRFFKLNPKDVEMMVRIVEWGKVNSAQVAETLTYGAANEALEEKSAEDPLLVIGQYLTDLILSTRRGVDINRILLTGMEAIYRCVRPTGLLLAFMDAPKQHLEGRSYLGPVKGVRASNFRMALNNPNSPVVRCMQAKKIVRASVRQELPVPFLQDLNFDSVLLAPIVVHGNAIGQCLAGRGPAMAFSEQEEAWIEAITGHFALAFERGK